MMNSRTRSSPPRGRGSSRSFVWKWYQICGSCLYDWSSSAWSVIVSSWLIGSRKRRPAAVLELEEHSDPVAARLLPELRRRQHRGEHLLAADRVHLLADDLHDLLVHAPAERQVRPEPRAHLADEASADEELVRGGLGLGRVVAHGRQEQLRRPGNHVFRIKNGRRRCGAGYSTGSMRPRPPRHRLRCRSRGCAVHLRNR